MSIWIVVSSYGEADMSSFREADLNEICFGAEIKEKFMEETLNNQQIDFDHNPKAYNGSLTYENWPKHETHDLTSQFNNNNFFIFYFLEVKIWR